MKGEYVIVRCNNAGVFFGIYENQEGNQLTLTNARKLHYWSGAAAVEEIAMIGTKRPDDCRFTVTVPSMVVADPIQVLPCQKQAVEAINSVKEWTA